MRAWAAVLALVLLSCGGQEERGPVRSRQTSTAHASGPVPKPLEGKLATVPAGDPIDRDLPAIRQRGELRVLFSFNSTGYFIYRGETMGYEYELLRKFARDQGLRLVPVVVRSTVDLFSRLNRGEGDVVAAQLIANATEREVKLTESLYATPPVVVQRNEKPLGAGKRPAVREALQRERVETPDPQSFIAKARPIDSPAQLAGQQMHLSTASPYRRFLLELDAGLPGDIDVVEVDESTDRLIQRLSEGDISFTVTAENVAALKAGEYGNLTIKPIIGPPHHVVWAVRRNAVALHDTLNAWLVQQRRSGLLNALYTKYFRDRRAYTRRTASRYLTTETGTLSQFDGFFRQYAAIPGWDWRLVAAQAYQESRFNPAARSWAGATGLMQIMPATARELRVNAHDPKQSVEGACRYLQRLDKHWRKRIPNEAERIKFILASYNVGIGHVEDAQRLAEKHGNDPARWNDVGYWLIRKSKRAVYNDPVVRYGFARGTEPVGYVDAILDRFEHYKAFVTDRATPG